MLHAVSGFAGEIELSADGSGQAQVIEISFSRAKPYFACKVRKDDRVITLLGGQSGSFEVFENAEVRPASEAEVDQFRLLSDLVDPRAIELVEPGSTSYRIRRKGIWYSVHIRSSGPGVHGHGAEHK